MYGLQDLIPFAFGAALLGYWWRISAQKARALQLTGEHCRRLGLQLLDQTLAFRRYRLLRDGAGKLRLCRIYAFDFCTDGEDRHGGEVFMAGLYAVRIVTETGALDITDFP